MNNEEAWNALFERYRIVDIVQREGLFRISAPTIKEYREPRLMTKFDFRGQLPTSFAENNLSILPVTRGDYIISTIETFQSLEDIPNLAIEEKEIPGDIESLDFSTITSDSSQLWHWPASLLPSYLLRWQNVFFRKKLGKMREMCRLFTTFA